MTEGRNEVTSDCNGFVLVECDVDFVEEAGLDVAETGVWSVKKEAKPPLPLKAAGVVWVDAVLIKRKPGGSGGVVRSWDDTDREEAALFLDKAEGKQLSPDDGNA